MVRWSRLNRFKGFKLFPGGIINLKFVRAFEHRSMAVGLPYVLHGLVNVDVAEQCSLAYLQWRMCWDNVLFCHDPLLDRDRVQGLGSVDELRLAGKELQRLMNELHRSNKGTQQDIDGIFNLNILCQHLILSFFCAYFVVVYFFIHFYSFAFSGTIKFHKIGHWHEWILEFGEPSNYNAETWETAHKWFVKRWIGKMALNGNGAISTLLRRNDIAEAHRSSTNLVDQNLQKRLRKTSLVLGSLGAGTYNKFFLEEERAWVSLGDTIAFGHNGDDYFNIARVDEIRLVSESVHIGVRMYKEASPVDSRPLSRYCTRRILDQAQTLKEINIHAANSYLSLFSVQPDFVDGGHFDCPFMDILN